MASSWMLTSAALRELQREIEELVTRGPANDAFTIRRKVFFLGSRFASQVGSTTRWRASSVPIRVLRQATGALLLQTSGPAPILSNYILHLMVDLAASTSTPSASPSMPTGARLGATESAAVVHGYHRGPVPPCSSSGCSTGTLAWSFAPAGYGTYLEPRHLMELWQVNQQRGIEPSLPEFDDDDDTWRGLHKLAEGQERVGVIDESEGRDGARWQGWRESRPEA